MCKKEPKLDTDKMTALILTNILTRNCEDVRLLGQRDLDEVKCPKCQHHFATAARSCCPGPKSSLHSFQPFLPAPNDFRRLTDTYKALRLSGWYHLNLDWTGASDLLKDTSAGTFLIRDSGDPNFIFSLSVQTERGPTSVRLHYERGGFRLDCEPGLAKYMPSFKCVVELVSHYVTMGSRGADGTVWVDAAGCPHSPVILRAPHRLKPPSLQHSARLAIHKALDADKVSPRLANMPKFLRLPLPRTLLQYLGEYQYPC